MEHLDGRVLQFSERSSLRLRVQADYNGRSTLHLAVSEKRTDVVKVLLDKGALTEQMDTWGRTPLSNALNSHSVDIVAALTSKGVPPWFCQSCGCPEGCRHCQ
jgi:ankyrin repeat protein